MSRARATMLVLVNWQGVFYEQYELDQHVTALEGANGAGKTTVMIAAYTVLLPDLGRLKFANLGESGTMDGDRGIRGRLGEGSTSYAALEFCSPEHPRLLAGVQLVRKGESVLPTMFTITDLRGDVKLEDLLLFRHGDVDQVPEIPEIRDAVAKAGAQMRVHPSARDYFSALFEAGVTPLRLGTEEEKNKLNEMLKTSMTGGISQALTNDLRSFLLRQTSELGSTLASMRENLDACRQTRTRVEDARRLQAEIMGVYEVGIEMFAAAMHATRERAAELQRAVERANAAHEQATQGFLEAEECLKALLVKRNAIIGQEGEARQRRDQAAQQAQRVTRAYQAATRLVEQERETATASEEQQRLLDERVQAEEQRAAAQAALGHAQETYRRAAAGLANLQAGLEELFRQAAGFQQASRALERAQTLLARPELNVSEVEDLLSSIETEQASLDREWARIDRVLSTADQRHQEYILALSTLAQILSTEVDPITAHTSARQALARLTLLDAEAERVSELAGALTEAQSKATLQVSVRERALALGIKSYAELERTLEATMRAYQVEEHGRNEQEGAAEAAKARLVTVREQVTHLERRQGAWREVVGLLDRLVEPIRGVGELDRLDRTLQGARDDKREEVKQLEESRDEKASLATELARMGGTLHPDLLRIRDEVEGELLITRFEDLEVDEAGPLQALLGPLADAVIVTDPQTAARKLAGRPREMDTIWLLAEERPFDPVRAKHSLGTDILVDEHLGVRVTRIPKRPTLGRKARQQRIKQLRAEVDTLETALETGQTELQRIERHIGLASELRSRLEILEQGDPTPDLETTRVEVVKVERLQRTCREAAAEAQVRSRELQSSLHAMQMLLPDARLLDPPDPGELVAEIEARHARALSARAEIERTRKDQALLSEMVEVLRVPPLATGQLEELRRSLQRVTERRDVLFHAIEALSFVQEHREALGWREAPLRLDRKRQLVPELEAVEAEARSAMEQAESKRNQSDEVWDQAVRVLQQADADFNAARSRRDTTRRELEETGVGDPSEMAVQIAHKDVEEAEQRYTEIETLRDQLAEQVGKLKERRDRANDEATQAAQVLADARQDARPHEERWKRLEAMAGKHARLPIVIAQRFVERWTGVGAVNVWPFAKDARRLLAERLGHAQRAADVLDELQKIEADEDRSAEGYLQVWLRVLDWLRGRLPAQIAEVDDPIEALGRLGDELLALEQRLHRQEEALRGASEDIASGIEVQIRTAAGQVQRLNRSLQGVQFGSVDSIRVQLKRVEHMGQILDALRQRQTQDLLFESTLPLEDALKLLFQRYGGAGASGQRLLDYREYIALQVEVKRKGAVNWEAPKLSTGEAIGVGAALMMVVLAEWERDANLLRGRRRDGSLRLLFLDEATRLDRDSLDELFDLCKNLELQLLIAAPEIARADGTTAYHLVRQVNNEGLMEVIVSGRRTRASP